MKPTFLELFAGAGGMSRGIEAGGFHCIGHSEIEPNARAVLRFRYPEVPLYGDVTKVTGEQTGPCDLVSFGAPCQDLSVAGKRAGLMGARSSLFFEGVRLWQETGATYALYENVMGALSSNGGKDFAVVLSTLVGAAIPVPANGWQSGGVAAGRDAVAAWRVLDLQHFGPPQRRVRVFVLAARAGGVDPAEVLALAEGVCGHPSPRQQAREGTAGRAAGGVGAGGVMAWDNELNASTEAHGPLMARGKSGGDRNGVLAFHHTQTPTVVPTITSKWAKGSGGYAGTTEHHNLVAQERGAWWDGSEVAGTLTKTSNTQNMPDKANFAAVLQGAADVAPMIDTTMFGKHTGNHQSLSMYDAVAKNTGRPRRLTPRECEALMSWPTNWTQYGTKEDGTVYELSDTARYRLCGNGVGSVCVEWIATRLADAIAAHEPMRAAA